MIRAARAVCLSFAGILVCSPAQAEAIRIATYNVELTRDGPGLALRDIRSGNDPQMQAISEVIDTAAPDILAVQGLDYDFGLETLTAFNQALPLPFPHVLALPTNRGLQTGLDLDGDGRAGDAADAQGFGRFYGQGAMAVLSRLPIEREAVQDFTDLLWADLPQASMPMNEDGSLFPSERVARQQRLSSSGHWVVPVQLPDGDFLSVMTFHASPPVFDGTEDRNGLRNAAEIGFWMLHLDGAVAASPEGEFIIAGSATLDPYDSEGRHRSIRDLLADPRLQDPVPVSTGAAQTPDQGHVGPNAQDTVDWDGVGRLRVDYLLPASTLQVTDAGVFWPEEGTPGHEAALRASRHRLVWVDILLE